MDDIKKWIGLETGMTNYNGDPLSMVRPTLGSRKAEGKPRQMHMVRNTLLNIISCPL